MSIFDEMFDPKFFWDDEYRQRRDIEFLRQEVTSAPNLAPQLRAQAARIDQLELMVKALTEVIVGKGLASRDELAVAMQQLDLEDGVEDGRVGRARQDAPTCQHCHRFVNPKRERCVYCGTPQSAQAVPQAAPAPSRPPVQCTQCHTTVPESKSYFTGGGLVCESCFSL